MRPEDLRERTRQFALRVIRFCRTLPLDPEVQDIRRQLGRACVAVASNYRAAGRGRSRAEFIAKIGTVVEESDECCLYFSLLQDLGAGDEKERQPLLQEAGELVAIFASSYNTASGRRRYSVRAGRLVDGSAAGSPVRRSQIDRQFPR
jgi:four helix bundle protein